MATLTWRDVANPQLRAPDLTDVGAAISRGIAGLGQTVADLGTADHRRMQEQAAQEFSKLEFLSGKRQKLAAEQDKIFTSMEQRKEKETEKEFNAWVGQLESGARQAALKGKTLNQFLHDNKIWQNMPEDARALAESRLSNAHWDGLKVKIQQDESAKSRAHSSYLARMRSQGEPREKPITTDPESLEALGYFTNHVAQQRYAANGGDSQKMSWGDISKASGVTDLSPYRDWFATFNAKRREHDLPAVDDGVLKDVIMSGTGKQGDMWGLRSSVDYDALADAVRDRSIQWDAALRMEQELLGVRDRIRKGGKYKAPNLTLPSQAPAQNAIVDEVARYLTGSR